MVVVRVRDGLLPPNKKQHSEYTWFYKLFSIVIVLIENYFLLVT